MIKKANSLTTDRVEGMKGGKGHMEGTSLLQLDEFCGKGRLFNRSVLKPGCSVGVHKHEGDFEVYYILSGHGMYTDNGVTSQVSPGDVTICKDGDTHGLENTGAEDLAYIALILFTK